MTATATFDAVDAVHEVGPYLVRRAQPTDALAYCRADAALVAGTYGYTMPPEFAAQRLAEADGLATERAEHFAADIAAEARGDEPASRTWVALSGDRIVATCVGKSGPQAWEDELDVVPIPGVTRQLNHLYVAEEARGTGLADALLALALPDGVPAYLWVVGGNDRACRFYTRHGFVEDPLTYSCGPVWFHKPLRRMYRGAGLV